MTLYDRIASRVHGSPYDRGASDSYYSRGSSTPHKGGVGGDSGPRVEDLTSSEKADYLQGYADNEAEFNFKDWG